jgi:hypothetical protein
LIEPLRKALDKRLPVLLSHCALIVHQKIQDVLDASLRAICIPLVRVVHVINAGAHNLITLVFHFVVFFLHAPEEWFLTSSTGDFLLNILNCILNFVQSGALLGLKVRNLLKPWENEIFEVLKTICEVIFTDGLLAEVLEENVENVEAIVILGSLAHLVYRALWVLLVELSNIPNIISCQRLMLLSLLQLIEQ